MLGSSMATNLKGFYGFIPSKKLIRIRDILKPGSEINQIINISEHAQEIL